MRDRNIFGSSSYNSAAMNRGTTLTSIPGWPAASPPAAMRLCCYAIPLEKDMTERERARMRRGGD